MTKDQATALQYWAVPKKTAGINFCRGPVPAGLYFSVDRLTIQNEAIY